MFRGVAFHGTEVVNTLRNIYIRFLAIPFLIRYVTVATILLYIPAMMISFGLLLTGIGFLWMGVVMREFGLIEVDFFLFYHILTVFLLITINLVTGFIIVRYRKSST